MVFYGRLAEIVGEYLRKGRSIYIEGRLKTRKWQDKQTGQDRYVTEIIAEQMQMLGGGNQQTTEPSPTNSATNAYSDAKTGKYSPPPATGNMDDDIPF